MDREVLISKFPVSSIQLHALFVSMFLNIICFCSTLCIIHLNQWHGTFLLQFPHICLEIFNYVVVHKICHYKIWCQLQLVRQNSSFYLIVKVVFNSTSFAPKMNSWNFPPPPPIQGNSNQVTCSFGLQFFLDVQMKHTLTPQRILTAVGLLKQKREQQHTLCSHSDNRNRILAK